MIIKNSVYIYVIALICFSPLALSQPISGYEFLSEQAQEMQNDSFQNPGYELVGKGHTLFNQVQDNGLSCSSCHSEDTKVLEPRSIAQFPKFLDSIQAPLTLRDQIQRCWVERLEQFPLFYTDTELLVLETYIRNLANGEKVNVDISGKMKTYYESGKQLYFRRFGQMDMTCAHCHDIYTGKMLRGQKLTQGHTNGFPLFRLESQKMVNLPQRLRECFHSLRAETYEHDSTEFRDLEIYLNARGNGLEIETPAVRY